MKGRNLLKKNEFYITVIIIVLACIIQVISGQFFTSNNLVDLLRSMIVPGMMAAGLFMVIVSGNIDVSFPYTAMLCMFAVTKWSGTGIPGVSDRRSDRYGSWTPERRACCMVKASDPDHHAWYLYDLPWHYPGCSAE